MAGKKSTLLTGSNAKIKVNDVTLAYATNITYSTTVHTVPVETMGRYEVVANEPIATTVSGNFAVVRYTAGAVPGDLMKAAASGGNGVGRWAPSDKPTTNLSTHFDPGKILTSQTFDIEIYRKGDSVVVAGVTPTSDGTEQIIKITDCRLTSKGGSLDKRGIYMEQFAFVGTGISDDSYTAGNSGDDDLD